MDPRLSKIDGLVLGDYQFQVGAYGNGRVAIQALYLPTLEPECTITVNLVDEDVEEGEFFVRLETLRHSRAPEALVEEGLVERTGKIVGAGFVENYAELWRLKVEE
jgi:hypothetical protein